MTTVSISRPVSFAGFPLPAWAFAVRVWLAAILALYASFWLELEAASSAALTVVILSLPTRGQGLEKAAFRLLATAAGIVVVFVLTGLLAQTGLPFLTACSLWIGACVYAAGRLDGNRAYAAALGAVTVSFIAVQNIDTPQNVFDAATARGAAIVVGIVALAFVNDILATPNFHVEVAHKLAALHARVRAHVHSLRCGTPPSAEETAHLLRDISSLRGDVSALGAESSNGRARRAAAQSAMANLVSLVVSARAVERAALIGLPDAPASGGVAAAALQRAAGRLRGAEREVQQDLEAFDNARFPPRRLRVPSYRSHSLALENAIAGALCFALASIVLVLSGWPSAELCLAFVGILIGLSATAPDRNGFAKVALMAAPTGCILAGVLEFVVLDGVTSFPLLALGFAPFVIGLALLMTLANPVVATLARTNLIFMIAVFGPSNPQAYDPQAFLFVSLFACLAAVLYFLVQFAVPGRGRAQQAGQLLLEARRDLRRCIRREPRPLLEPEEEEFRNAVRLGQVLDLSTPANPRGNAVAAALHLFDVAASLRSCRSALDRTPADGVTGLVAKAREDLRRADGPALLTAARTLETSPAWSAPGARDLAAAQFDAGLALCGPVRPALSHTEA